MTHALALERLLLDPRFADYVQQVRAVLPAHLVDQVDAAADEAHEVLAAFPGRTARRPATAAELPSWLRLGLVDTLLTFTTGRATTCLHNPTASRPQPVLAAAWRPGVVVCLACAPLLSLKHDPAADSRCDGCGHQCAGVDENDGIYPGRLQLGPLIYQYGCCTDCRPAITPDTGPLRATQSTEPDAPRGTGRVRPRGQRGRGRGKGDRR
ncbi:hypothetical protein [Micromonospora sp. NPDC049033]|uniref:hypothetical protein n=1 Tax=Micromonospora sp. NPDC049033 TaxID=3155149 RepID=UPI0033E530DB